MFIYNFLYLIVSESSALTKPGISCGRVQNGSCYLTRTHNFSWRHNYEKTWKYQESKSYSACIKYWGMIDWFSRAEILKYDIADITEDYTASIVFPNFGIFFSLFLSFFRLIANSPRRGCRRNSNLCMGS